MALQHCNECQKEVSTLAATCPHCGAPGPATEAAKKEAERTAAAVSSKRIPEGKGNAGCGSVFFWLIGILVALIILASILPSSDNDTTARSTSDPKKEADRKAAELEKAAKEAEERRNGFHCLSKWDGSHDAFKRDVKGRMRNPKSFEHVETRVSRVKDGQHTIVMTFRAENGFGGMTVGNATGVYQNSDCSYTILSIE